MRALPDGSTLLAIVTGLAALAAYIAGVTKYVLSPADKREKRTLAIITIAGTVVVALLIAIVAFVTAAPSGARTPQPGDTLFVNRSPGGPVYDVSWSPDGQLIASGSSDGTVRVWAAKDGTQRYLVHEVAVSIPVSGVMGMAWSPDGAYLATATRYVVHVREANTGRILRTYSGGGITSLAFSLDGRYLAAGDFNAIHVWDMTTGQTFASYTFPAKDTVLALSWAPDDSAIAVGAGDLMYLWRPATLHISERYDSPGLITEVAWSPDGRYVAAGGADGTVLVWQSDSTLSQGPQSLTCPAEGTGATWLLFGLGWSPNSRYLVYSCGRTVRVIEPAIGHTVLEYNGHSDHVIAVAWSPDGTQIASGSADDTVRVWRAPAGW